MTFYNYSITTFFDFGCQQDPIIIVSSKSGCELERACQLNPLGSLYVASEVSCSSEPVNFFAQSHRDYVVKSLFTNSEDCTGTPLTQYVVAGDYACHPNPQVGREANNAYFQVSCNGQMPIWNSCTDTGCTNCTAITATSPCMIGGAGTSNGYHCFKASTSATSTTITTPTSIPSVSTTNASASDNSASSAAHADAGNRLLLLFVLWWCGFVVFKN
jgi:hypothetical protein